MFTKLTSYLIVVGALLLQACATTDLSFPTQETTSSSEQESIVIEQTRTGRISDPILRARILADMLFEASMAFDDNRLMLPAGDNAYDRYLEVLSFDPR